jgi:hypothetical protein
VGLVGDGSWVVEEGEEGGGVKLFCFEEEEGGGYVGEGGVGYGYVVEIDSVEGDFECEAWGNC